MSDNINFNQIDNAKKVLIKFVVATSKILKRLSENNEIPPDDTIFTSEEEQKELEQLIKNAYNELKIDPDKENNNYDKLDDIINNIKEIKDELN